MKSWKAPLVATFALFVFGAGGACSTKANEGGSETNWAKTCDTDADCDAGQCICGKCADTCDPATTCTTGRNPCGAVADGGPLLSYTTHTWFADALVSSSTPAGDAGAELTGRCLPREIPVGESGEVPCRVIAVQGSCTSCDESHGYFKPTAIGLTLAQRQLRAIGACDAPGAPSCLQLCYCELHQLHGACETEVALPDDPAGFCYVDPAEGGNPALVQKCAPAQRRILRLTPNRPDETVVISCETSTSGSAQADAPPAPIGGACTPRDDTRADFSGHSPIEVSVDIGSPSCESGVCLADHFAGTTTCPYGQGDPTTANVPASERCHTAGSNPELVTVPVTPQKVIRPADTAVYCSCRCDGPDPSATYCQCPSGFECTQLIPSLGVSGELPSSFCTKVGDRPPASGDFGTDCVLPATERRAGGCGPIAQ